MLFLLNTQSFYGVFNIWEEFEGNQRARFKNIYKYIFLVIIIIIFFYVLFFANVFSICVDLFGNNKTTVDEFMCNFII